MKKTMLLLTTLVWVGCQDDFTEEIPMTVEANDIATRSLQGDAEYYSWHYGEKIPLIGICNAAPWFFPVKKLHFSKILLLFAVSFL